MKEKEKMCGLHSRCYNVSCDLVLSHMSEDLEKGNSVICKIFFFEIHCKDFLCKFLSHFLICFNTQQPPVLCVYNLLIYTSATSSISSHIRCLYPLMMKTSSALENRCKYFLKDLQYFCKDFAS